MCSTATRIRLDPGQSTRLPPARPAHVSSVLGTLWVTIDHDPRDIVLEAGQSLALRGDAPAVVSPLGGPAVLELAAAATTTDEPVSAW